VTGSIVSKSFEGYLLFE